MIRRRLAACVAALAGAALVLLGTPAPAGAGQATGPPVPLRVASYNIHAGIGSDGAFDLDRTAEAIRALDADVVGLEEVDVNWG
ncbi:MAG: hypothetical protein WCB04_00425, partial [Mycobacteriales bacterium]